VPALGWLQTYQRGWLRADAVAGITLAAYLLPAGLGDASLAIRIQHPNSISGLSDISSFQWSFGSASPHPPVPQAGTNAPAKSLT